MCSEGLSLSQDKIFWAGLEQWPASLWVLLEQDAMWSISLWSYDLPLLPYNLHLTNKLGSGETRAPIFPVMSCQKWGQSARRGLLTFTYTTLACNLFAKKECEMLVVCPSWEDAIASEWDLGREGTLYSFHSTRPGVSREGADCGSNATDSHCS